MLILSCENELYLHENKIYFHIQRPGGTRKWPLYLDVFNSESTRREKLFPPLSATHVLALDKTHLNKYALSAKLCVSGFMDIAKVGSVAAHN